MSVTMPNQDPEKYDRIARERESQALRASGGPSGGTIAIGAVMLVAGIGLSAAGTGRVFIGLIVVGVITLIRGLIGK
jgi:hypothetical protein